MKTDSDLPSQTPAAATEWRFSLHPLADKAGLGQQWRRLETKDTPFFLSWAWIGCWLDHMPPDQHPLVLRAERAGQMIGLALLTPRPYRWLGMIPGQRLYLHETGSAELDSLTIEYNAIHTAPELRDGLLQRAVEWLMQSATWQELHLSGIDEALEQTIDAQRFAVLRRDHKPVYVVNLERIRATKGSYPDSLSANTRSQLRRAIRQFGALGDARIAQAGSVDEALSMFEGMMPLHQDYWRQRGKSGAFANPTVVSFHRQLIREAFDHIQLLRCDAGASTVGYLYNFVKDGRVISYQSGFDYALLPRAKPGWLCHDMAIDHNLAHGMAIYDLLAGYSQFKASFAEPAENLVWITVERNGWKPSVVKWLRRAKVILQTLRKIRPA